MRRLVLGMFRYAVLVLLIWCAGPSVTPAADKATESVPGRWTAQRAAAWHRAEPWLVGCNFLPSSAVNDVEMWQKETFDPKTIGRELGWARQLGFNTVRVFLNFVVWRDDAEGLKSRFDQFLAIAAGHGIRVMPVLLDDCNFAGRVAGTGKQPDPVPGVHNSQWVSSPPLAMVTDRAAWPALEQYVGGMVSAFGRDPRVVVWDLYNEPGNSGQGDRSLPLVDACFTWARRAQPTQPLTVGAWADLKSPASRRMMELSDVISFHGYDALPGIEAKLVLCSEYGRPVLCTEWLLRQNKNDFLTLLPLFKQRKIGCWSWGLVAGRTQTYFPWGSKQGSPEPNPWQHDLLRRDGEPYRAEEASFIKATVGKESPAPRSGATRAAAPAEFYAYCLEMGVPHHTPRPLAEQARILRELGYDGIGLALDGQLEANLKTLDQAKSQLYLVWTSVNVNPDKGAAYPASLPQQIRQLRGRPTVVCVLLQGLKPGDPRGMGPAIKALRELGDAGAQAGVRISIYNHVNDWAESLPWIVDVVRKANHPQVGYNFNLCHWLKVDGAKDYRPLLQASADRLFVVTINGATKGAADWAGLIRPLDEGDFDQSGLLAALGAIGYRGPIGLMCYGIPGEPRPHLERSMKAWRALQTAR